MDGLMIRIMVIISNDMGEQWLINGSLMANSNDFLWLINGFQWLINGF